MAINFPSTPTDGQQYTENGKTWSYSTSASAWLVVASADLTVNTVNASGNVTAAYFIGNGSALTGITTDISPAFDKANSANIIASQAFDKANSANVLAFNTGLGANAFAAATIAGANTAVGTGANNYLLAVIAGANTAVGAGANAFTSTTVAGANSYMTATVAGANTAVGTGANAFASATIAGANTAVGTGANNYLLAVIAGANTAVGAGANAYMIAVQNGSNTAVGAGANAFTSSTVAGANTAVGTGANAFTSSTVAGANTAVGTGANAFTSSTVAGANTAVGEGANAFTSATIAGANTAVGTGANNYLLTVIAGANTAVGAGANNYANGTFVKLIAGNQVITGNLAVTGSLTISGNAFSIDTETLKVSDPLIYLAGNNYSSDIVDIGFVANYVNSTGYNVHTGLFRDATVKQYYLFEGYDKEPVPNHIDTAGNNFTLSTLNANFVTNNLVLGGINTIPWITSAYDKANAANVLAYNTGIGANAFAAATVSGANTAVGGGANAYAAAIANTIAIAAFNRANTANLVPVGNTLTNSYTLRSTRNKLNFIPGLNIDINIDDDSAGDRANITISTSNISNVTYTTQQIKDLTSENLVVTSIQPFYGNVVDSTIAYAAYNKANTANLLAFNTGIGANAFAAATVAGANTAVGAGANAFTSATVAGANTAVGEGANAFAAVTVSGANTAVGGGANAFTSATVAGANTISIAAFAKANAALPNTSGVSFAGNLFFPAGNVGIGTTTPSAIFHTINSNGPGFRTGDGTNDYTIGRDGTTGFLQINGLQSSFSGYMFRVNNGTDVLRITNAGNVGIGNTNPGAKLAVQVSSDASDAFYVGSTTLADRFKIIPDAGANVGTKLVFNTGNGGTIDTSGPGYATVLRLNPNGGNVGIGNTNPGALLHVGSTAVQYTPRIGTRVNGNAIEFGHTNQAGYGSVLGAEVGSGAPFLAFNCGAGTNNNTYKTFGIKGVVIKTDNAGGLLFNTVDIAATTDNQSLTERMRITESGRIGINTTSPSANLDVTGNVNITTDISIQNDLKANSGYGSSEIVYGPRVWMQANGQGTVAIRKSGNITSLTDNGVGDYTINFTRSMPDGNYAVTGIVGLFGGSRSTGFFGMSQPNTANVRIFTTAAALSGFDWPYVNVIIIR